MRHSLVAAGDIGKSRFVTLDTSNDFRVDESNANEMPFGISQEFANDAPSTASASSEAATSGETIGIYGQGEECFLECGTTITRGDILRPDADGKALVTAAGQKYGAFALESGTSSELIRVVVNSGELET